MILSQEKSIGVKIYILPGSAAFSSEPAFSLVVPFMALFVEELGVTGKAVPLYAGIAVASSSVTSAIMSPIWGSLADRYGRKPMMLRASIAMTLTMGGIAFVPSVFWLLVLRLLNGVFSGFVPNSTALIASQVPKDQSGYALGTLSTGVVAGTLMGPLIGGLIAENLGMRNVFLLVGFFLFWVSLLTFWGIEEDYEPLPKEEQNPVGSCSCPFSKKISSWDSF